MLIPTLLSDFDNVTSEPLSNRTFNLIIWLLCFNSAEANPNSNLIILKKAQEIQKWMETRTHLQNSGQNVLIT